MIDAAIAFTREGIILWCQIYDSLDLNFINKVIQKYLLSEKSNLDTVLVDSIHCRWSLINEYNAQVSKDILNKSVSAFKKSIKKHWDETLPLLLESKLFDNFSKEFTKIVSSMAPLVDHSNRSSSPEPQNKNNEVNKNNKENGSDAKAKKTKENRSWSYRDKITQKEIDALDFSDKAEPEAPEPSQPGTAYQYIDSDSDSDDEENGQTSLINTFYGKAFNLLHSYIGNKTLTSEDVDTHMVELKALLTSRNVSPVVCDMLCESVKKNLVGKKTSKFVTVKTAINESLSNAVAQVLTYSNKIDICAEAEAHRNKNSVYTIVFCGVNGVGKSTTLAKVCYLLKNKKFKVLISACDTFRSGAVEQLKTHARCLEVEVFDRGYGKNPDEIAKASIAHAELNRYDVVLIDTAGRMQDNEPLMKALAKLVQVNDPSRIFFVGEALVGNDGIDQLQKFNDCFKNSQRGIDGIILTKFDTVDNKVGTALSMCYSLQIPIVFVGTGQNYNNLKPLNPASVVKYLTS